MQADEGLVEILDVDNELQIDLTHALVHSLHFDALFCKSDCSFSQNTTFGQMATNDRDESNRNFSQACFGKGLLQIPVKVVHCLNLFGQVVRDCISVGVFCNVANFVRIEVGDDLIIVAFST